MWRRRLLDLGIPYVVWSVIYTFLAVWRGRQIDARTFLWPAGHREGLGSSLLHRADIPILPSLPRDVEGSAILEAPAFAVARNRGACPGCILHVGPSGYLPYPTGQAGRRGLDSTCSPGCLRGWILTLFRIGRGRTSGQLWQYGQQAPPLNCSVSAAIRLKTPHALLGYGELIVNIYAVASCLFFLAVSQWVTARGGLPARAALSLSRAVIRDLPFAPPGTCDMEALDRYGQSRPFPSIGVGWGCSSPCRIVVRDCHAQADKVGWMIAGK